MSNIRDRITNALAQHLFYQAVAAFKPQAKWKWEEIEESVRQDWRNSAAPLVDQLGQITIAELEEGLDRAAKALWEHSYRNVTIDKWEDLNSAVRDAYVEQARSVLTAWFSAGVVQRLKLVK